MLVYLAIYNKYPAYYNGQRDDWKSIKKNLLLYLFFLTAGLQKCTLILLSQLSMTYLLFTLADLGEGGGEREAETSLNISQMEDYRTS